MKDKIDKNVDLQGILVKKTLIKVCSVLWIFPSAVPMAQNNALQLEEVVVVATKRESSLQDVAVAVSAVPDWVLQNNQIFSSADLTNVVPSLTLQKGLNSRESSFNIRGIGTQSYSVAAEPSVSTLVDGVVMGISGQAFTQLADIQRVEVLRGPQGTLFGKNASAGAVHIITRKPASELEASIRATVVEQDEYRLTGSVSAPLIESWSFRLTGSYIDDGGYIDNVYDPLFTPPGTITLNDSKNPLGGGKDSLVRGKLAWEPNQDLRLLYTGDWGKNDCDCGATIVRSTSEPERLAPLVPSDENMDVNVDGPNFSKVESYGHALEINWQVGELSLTSLSAYRDWQQEFQADVDGQPIVAEPLLLFQSGEDSQKQFSQELRLLSPEQQSLSYVVGLYYFSQETERLFFRSILGLDNVTDLKTDKKNYALFGEATWNLSDHWRLIFGGRLSRDEVDYGLLRDGPFPGPILPDHPNSSGDVVDDNFSGKLALQRDVGQNGMAYASYAQGYKGPAYSIDATTDPDLIEVVKPETSDAFELGYKGRLLDSRLQIGLAAFYTEFEDWQATAFVPAPSGDNTGTFLLTNAGKVSTRGVELDATLLLAEGFTLFGALAYTKAEIDSFKGGPCNFVQQANSMPPSCGPAGGGVQDLSGGDLPYSPEWRFNLTGDYQLALESMPFDLGFNVNYRWQSEVQFDIAQDVNGIQDSYGILDAAIDLKSKHNRHALRLFAKNLLDEFHVLGISSTTELLLPDAYLHQVSKTAQRTFGVEYRFEL